MSLSCGCDFEPFDYRGWFWMGHSDLRPMPPFGKRRRCYSCNNVIQLNEDSIEFYRYRIPNNDIEERIYGEFKPLASLFMCEECSALYLVLEESGYNCLNFYRGKKL